MHAWTIMADSLAGDDSAPLQLGSAFVERTKPVNVAAILQAVYRRPTPATDALAQRVRARLSLLDTLAECARLLIEAPASALNTTVKPHVAPAPPDADGEH